MKIKAFLALLLVCCILLPALAQTNPVATSQPQKKTDDRDDVVRITTNLVQVDVVVTKDGKTVPNLTAEDFEIFQDGRLQTITSFTYISNLPETTSPSSTAVRDKTTDIVPFSPLKPNDPRRTIALVVDDIGLSAQSMAQVRRQIRKFVAEELQPNDLVAIIRTGGEMGALQQFTNDKRILNRAVDLLRWNACSRVGINIFPIAGGGGHDPNKICGGRSYEQTLSSLRFILDSMGQLPGRKSMILLSDSMPIESQEASIRPTDASTNEDEPALPVGFSDSMNYSAFLDRIAEKAIRSSVVIYSVDTQALVYTGPTAADSFRGNARAITAQMQSLMSSRFHMLHGRREGAQMLARQTGGFQVRNSNDFKLDRVLADQTGYYLLGYRPTEETFNKRFHRIKARVKRSGMSVRTRFGFYGITEEEASQARLTPRDMTNLALASPFAAQDIELDLTSFFVNDKVAGSAVRSFVYIDAKNLTLAVVDGRHQGAIDLHGVIFGDNGSIAQQVQRVATLNLSERGYQQAMNNGIGIALDIPIKRAGAYQVRVAAKDRNSSRIGSAGQFVAVPNLDNKHLAVSGIVLGTMAEPTGDGNQAIANPGTRRFKVNSDLYLTYMIYNAASERGSQLRSLVTELRIFRDGKIVHSSPEQPTAVHLSDLNRMLANGVVRLTPDLEPGHYYLQVVIADKGAKNKTAPVVQWVDFEIVK